MAGREIDPELARQIEMEERAHRLRLEMYHDAEFMAALREGIAADERDEVITLEELDAKLRARRMAD
jgi:hypothetical protein